MNRASTTGDPASHSGVRRASIGSLVVWMAVAAAGCASGGAAQQTGLLTSAMQAVGLSKPAPPELPIKELPTLNRKLTLRLHAGTVLNTDPAGRSLAVVARVYKLRDSAAFQRTPYEAFQNSSTGSAKDAPPFAQDVVDVREIVLTPGMTNDVIETLTPDARYLAVVALFRAPAESRWRFVFESKAAVASGVTLGAHGCALSVAQGQPLDTTPEAARLAGVRCQ